MKKRGGVFIPFSWAYGTGMFIRNLTYKAQIRSLYKAPVPVISIGNLSVGGTGKTPTTMHILEILSKKGIPSAMVSRGYGRKTRGYRIVDGLDPNTDETGDEPAMVAMAFPHVPVAVCENRAIGIKKVLRDKGEKVIILDDAFQHVRVLRDLDIVMIDASRSPFEDKLLPAGRLRESPRALSRADFVVVTKVEDENSLKKVVDKLGDIPWAVLKTTPVSLQPFSSKENPLHPEALAGRQVVLFSGIGNNDHFRFTVRSLRAKISGFFPFKDHHRYKPADLETISAKFKKLEIGPDEEAPILLTTEKDYVRLRKIPGLDKMLPFPLYYLKIRMSSGEGWDQLEEKLWEILKEYGFEI